MTTSADDLVRDYLDRLGRAVAGLPAADREELLEQITGHIASARADAAAAGEEDGPAVTRRVLDRLGPPEEVAAAAAGEQPHPPRRPIRLFGEGSATESAAVLLCGLGWVIAFGWLFGLVLGLRSKRWNGWQKTAVALLPIPSWLMLTGAHAVSAADGPAFLFPVFVVLAIAAPLLAGAWLVSKAR
jgi:hypothetical protein